MILNVISISECFDNLPLATNSSCLNNTWTVELNGTCYFNGSLMAIWDTALAKKVNLERKLPTEEYFE